MSNDDWTRDYDDPFGPEWYATDHDEYVKGIDLMREMKQAVVVVIPLPDGTILSVSRPGQPNLIGLPGGKVEDGEKLHSAALRELQEETGFSVSVKVMPLVALPCVGDQDYWVTCFLGELELPSQLKKAMGPPFEVEPGITVSRATWEELRRDASVNVQGLRQAPFADYNRVVYEALWIRNLRTPAEDVL